MSSLSLTVLALAAAALTAVPSPSPRARPLSSHAAADSGRSDDAVRLVALHHAAEVRRCYEAEGLRRNPQLAGTLEVELRVLPTGRVDSASVGWSDLAGPGTTEVERCVAALVRNWRFARGPYAVETIVYPFTLEPGMAEKPRRQSA